MLVYINKHPEGVDAKQIAKALKLSGSTVNKNLQPLRNYQEVIMKMSDGFHNYRFVYYPKA